MLLAEQLVQEKQKFDVVLALEVAPQHPSVHIKIKPLFHNMGRKRTHLRMWKGVCANYDVIHESCTDVICSIGVQVESIFKDFTVG